jgi:hypothetical protein
MRQNRRMNQTSPKEYLAKARKVRLELANRPCIEGLPIGVTDLGASIYRHPKPGLANTFYVAFADIEAVWDIDAGRRVWRR